MTIASRLLKYLRSNYVFIEPSGIKADKPENIHIFTVENSRIKPGQKPAWTDIAEKALCSQARITTLGKDFSKCMDADETRTQAAVIQNFKENPNAEVCGNCVRSLYADHDSKKAEALSKKK